ncbi:MAG: ABC transporter substrate-binding protein [Planctomycetota bacterium]|nr:ABC transporter substrate-binding protein [Planctomycetota bacterium]
MRLMTNLFAIGFAVALLTGCGESREAATESGRVAASKAAAKEKVSLLLNWVPEAEHGGFYAAEIHGYFDVGGLDVEIQPGGKSSPVLQQVARKQVMFGVTNADQVVTAWAAGAKVVAVMAPIQDSPRCIIVHAKSGIESFEDLANLTLSISSTTPWAKYMIRKLSLNDKNVRTAPPSLAQFMSDENVAVQGYSFSEPFTAKEKGGDPKELMVSELGFNPYTSVLITHPDIIAERPELVRKMVKACTWGWRAYLARPARTNERIHELNQAMSPAALEFGAKSLIPLCLKNGSDADVGSMTLQRWKTLVDQMVEVEAIESEAVNPEQVFTDQFLK